MAEGHPRIRAALAAQLTLRSEQLEAGAERVGWKLSFDIAEIEALIGPAPVFGYLTSATVLAPGSRYSAGGTGELRAETELAVDIGDGGGIAGVAVALELNDVSRPPFDAESIVAHNVFHRAVAFGPTRPHATLDGLEARLLENGALRAAAPVDVDPERSIATLAELLEEHAERLEPGDRVITGGLTHVPVGRGASVRAEIDGLGQVVLEIA